MTNLIDYRAVPKVEGPNGMSLRSKMERALYNDLWLRQCAGEISELTYEPSVYLTDANILYKPDFSARETKTGEVDYHESKGFKTPVYQIKRRLWKVYGPGKLHVYGGSHKRLTLFETITPKLRVKKENRK